MGELQRKYRNRVVIKGNAIRIIIDGLINPLSQVGDPRCKSINQNVVHHSRSIMGIVDGRCTSSANKMSVERIRNSMRKGIKRKFPMMVIPDIGSPHATKKGNDHRVTNNCN
jgi:hypothetical protein